jgi:hypothetical protein
VEFEEDSVEYKLNPDVFKLHQAQKKNLNVRNLNIYKRNLYELLTHTRLS